MLKHFTLTNVTVVALTAVTAVAVFVLLEGIGSNEPLEPWPRFVNGKRAFPNVELVNQHGETVRFYDDLVKDRNVFVYFIYTRCEGTCVPTTLNLVQVQKLLQENIDEDVRFIAITLDPEHDQPEVLENYREQNGAGDDWVFLTGDFREITQLRRHLGFYDLDPEIDADKTEHASLVAYGNDRTGRWGAAPALLPPKQVASAALLVFAEYSKKSDPADRLAAH